MSRNDGLSTHIRAWLRVAADRAILRRALVTSVLVGVGLALINHGDKILSGQLASGDILPISLTFVIPFAVATASSVAATKRSASAGSQPGDAQTKNRAT